MNKYEYNCIAYRQSLAPKAPWLISFVAPAEELLIWAGIPRRADEKEIGFQRAEDPKRVDRAKNFFQMAGNNQSPTSLVVGIHPQSDERNRFVDLVFCDENNDSYIRNCKLVVNLPEAESIERVVERIKSQVNYRLDNEEGEVDSESDINESNDNEENNDDEPNEDSEDDLKSSDREIEIGRSILGKFMEKLENPVWCENNQNDLREIAKPATIIDGQHRVLGAAKCERNIPFSICAIYDCEWPEQVYQFTVVNYTAKGIPDQFITANAAMSLTRDELDTLEQRLSQAGVKVVEYELMRIINFDDRSPFYDLVNLTEKSDNTKIGYKTMIKIARSWYAGKNNAVKKIIKNIYPDITGKQEALKKLERWKDGDWGIFFITFWNAVKNKYKSDLDYRGKNLFEVGSNLTIAIVLFELQERFLINLNSQSDSFFAPKSEATAFEDLRQAVETRVNELLEYIPPRFFAIKWETKSLNTGAGRDVLQSALRELVESSGSFKYGNCRLVTGRD